MKKKIIRLDRKLILNKETVTTLGAAQAMGVVGGSANCPTVPATNCFSCNANCPVLTVFPSGTPNCCVAQTHNCPTLQSCDACPLPTLGC